MQIYVSDLFLLGYETNFPRHRSFFFGEKATMADQPPAAPASAAAASPAEEGLTEKVSKMAVSSDTSNNNNDNNGGKKNKNKGGNNGSNKQAPPAPPREWTAEMQADYERILSVGEECISASELKGLITAKGRGSDHELGFNLYDGFEPSGRMHIAQVSRVESSRVSLQLMLCIFIHLFQNYS